MTSSNLEFIEVITLVFKNRPSLLLSGARRSGAVGDGCAPAAAEPQQVRRFGRAWTCSARERSTADMLQRTSLRRATGHRQTCRRLLARATALQAQKKDASVPSGWFRKSCRDTFQWGSYRCAPSKLGRLQMPTDNMGRAWTCSARWPSRAICVFARPKGSG